jgi:type VI secretion system secreted protein VgrG
MTDIVSITSAKCDNLRFVTMTAKECLGQLFDFQVHFESEDQSIDLTGLLGSSMTVKLTTENGFVRCFNGMVVSAMQTGVDYVEDLV